MQGRVSPEDHASGRAALGYQCNAELVGAIAVEARGTVGGLKVERYIDGTGRECGYYDSTLLFPTNIFDGEGGVVVLDMSDPSHPKVTDRLVTPAMLSPHESLVLSQRRGLLVAVAGNPVTLPGIVDIYDVSADCRHPVLRASSPTGILGHESGLAPDGNTFYSASPFSATIVAVDISNPDVPVPLWTGQYDSHGLSISDDGNRAYVAALSGLRILDTSEIQARRPSPEVHEISTLAWTSMSTPQNAIPVRIDGHPFLVEIDEFAVNSTNGASQVGAGRIIDIADEANPQVVSNLRLEVHQAENQDALADDPPKLISFIGYSGHYCNVPQRINPGIVACSMIPSGLRVFDIRDPYHPREIAYFNPPMQERAVGPSMSFAMASPAFAPERNEIWYTDGFSGFYAIRLTNGVWPATEQASSGATTSGTDRLPATGRASNQRIAVVVMLGGVVGMAVAFRVRRRAVADPD